ncbi:MAG: glycosyltransferase family 61 protein [Bacteroidetes bacterium]|nr:glycosyltransferase family 61 protein [Bacteroidota bacterium]
MKAHFSLKKVLKKLFPVLLLKKAFLLYNRIRIATFDRLIFPELRINANEFKWYRRGHPFVENSINLSGITDHMVRKLMSTWYQWTQEEFLLILEKQCMIEPKFGWGIVNRRKLVYYSLGISRTPFQKKPEIIPLLAKKNEIRLKQAISLRDTGEENYFHLYNDVLAKIFFLKSFGVDVEEYTVIVAGALWDKPYFKAIVERSTFLRSLPWLVQREEYLVCDKVVFCKPMTHRLDLWKEIVSPFVHRAGGQRRIFITRSKESLRYLENENEVISLFKIQGIEIYNCDALSLEQQSELFASAVLIIGIHGAGLTNLIYRNSPCHVIELFPPPESDYLPFHYVMLAGQQGFTYDAVIGEWGRERHSGGFCIDVSSLSALIATFDKSNNAHLVSD